METLNVLGAEQSTLKNILKTSELQINHEYKIDRITLAQTKYGPKYLLDLGEKVFFLPTKISEGLTTKNFTPEDAPPNMHMVVTKQEHGQFEYRFILKSN